MRNLGFYVGSLASSFAKRIVNSHYDSLAQQAFFRDLQQRAPGEKFATETLFYGVGSIIDAYLGESNALRKFTKEMTNDGFSNMSARIFHKVPYRASDVWCLAELTNEQLGEFLEWYESRDERMRVEIRRTITRHTTSQVSRMLKLHPSTRERLFKISMESRPIVPRRIEWIENLASRMERWMGRIPQE